MPGDLWVGQVSCVCMCVCCVCVLCVHVCVCVCVCLCVFRLFLCGLVREMDALEWSYQTGFSA